jgi:hypothetical protein
MKVRPVRMTEPHRNGGQPYWVVDGMAFMTRSEAEAMADLLNGRTR